MTSRVDRAFERFRHSGNPRALARVFDATAKELYRLAFHLVGDAHAAEDLVQATFLVAIEDAASFAPGSAVLPWLCGILAHRARDLRRHRQRRQRIVPPASGEVVDPVADASSHELSEVVAREVRALPEPYRQVLLLHLEHGLGGKEIAEAQSKPEATVRSQIHRGLELLRKALPVGIAGLARAAMPPARLDGVRAAVLARAGMSEAAMAALATFSGVLAMKKILLGGLVLALLLLCSWPLWPAGEPSPVGGAAAASAAPVTSGASVAAAEQAPAAARRDLAGDESTAAGVLEVLVQWEDGGQGAADVTVRCLPQRAEGDLWLRAARTDATGIARFAGVAAGKVVLYGDRGGKLEVDVAGAGTERVIMTLPDGLDVRGRVEDVEGQPIAGAEVWLSIDVRKDDGELVARAGGDGSFELRGVTTHRVLSAAADGFACANPVVVTAMNARSLVLQLRRAPGSLLGTVLDAAGRPVPNARVMVGTCSGGADQSLIGLVSGADLWPARYFRTDETGRFTVIGLPPFRWPVWVRAPGHAGWSEDVQVDEHAATPLTVRLQMGAGLAGRVTTKDGLPAAGAQLLATQTRPKVDNRITFYGWRIGPGYMRAEAKAGEDGSFALENLVPGNTKVTVWFANTSVSTDLDLVDGRQASWNPALAPTGLPLHGIVVDTDGKPLVGWWVHDKSENGIFDTDAEGRFRWNNVKDAVHPLRVRASSKTSKPIGRWLEVGDRRPGPEAVRIEVPRRYIPTARLRGCVLEADGGAPTVELSLTLLEEPDQSHWLANEIGRFDCLVAEGRYRLTASGRLVRDVVLGEWDVAPGADLDAGALHLPARPPTGRIAVTVVDSGGRRIPHAWVDLHPPGQGWERRGVGTKEGAGAGDFPPGRYVLSTRGNVPLVSQEVEIAVDRTTEVVLRVPDGVRFVLRVPPGRNDVQVSWRDGNGTVVCETGESMWMSAEPSLRERWLAAGSYTIEVKDQEGRTATARVDIRAADPPVIVDLPLPQR